MKALTLALLLSLPTPKLAPPPPTPSGHLAEHVRNGRWYFAANGHAVYCYGPVMMVTQAKGGLQKVATFCQGDKVIVPLKD